MNFLTADDMSAILAVKLRKRLGFGMWAKLHITGMHVEGKVLINMEQLFFPLTIQVAHQKSFPSLANSSSVEEFALCRYVKKKLDGCEV